ncbi:acyltransferase [Paeniglutamicibacter terrestris]|uniref:Transferase n=1 Tax=Paeniglutamicibacter terrestris TaxID=2723403 RepID=A0ABX1G9N4_9MICC|nr:acyltransferase [Paeniglutamicibacter terrestris]NKG22734.1 transferase [Paeniglutamicibacter terrestris]
MPSIEERLAELERKTTELEAELIELRPSKSWKRPAAATVGSRPRIHPTVVMIASEAKPIVIGENVQIRRGAEIVGPVSIGSGSSFNRDAYIRANVHIGKNCNIGAFCRFISDTHEVGTSDRRAGAGSFPEILIGDGSWIGAGSTILGGVTVGESCIIAAGSLVIKDIPANTMVGGVPAKKIKDLD